MDLSQLERLRMLKYAEETDSERKPDKRKGSALRRKIRSEEDLNREFPERKWVTLLRLYYRPVRPLRIHEDSTEPARSHGSYGEELWKIGPDTMTKREAIKLAEELRCSKKPPRWGTIDGRFGDSFLDEEY